MPEKIVAKDKEDLKRLIGETVKKNGPNCDLNFIDVSQVTDMGGLFAESDFNGDISGWNVSNVTRMNRMFYDSEFNGDLSHWDVSNVCVMTEMFCKSKFNGDISHWNVFNVKYMGRMFAYSCFNGNISKWNVSKETNIGDIFIYSDFEGEVGEWEAVKERIRYWKELDEKFGGNSEPDSSDWVEEKEPIDVLDLPEEKFVRVGSLAEYDLYVNVVDKGSAF